MGPQHRDDGFEKLRALRGEKRGVDVRRINQRIDWQRVAKADVHFAYIKSTQGATRVDWQFATSWEDTKVAGLAHGAYHVFSFC